MAVDSFYLCNIIVCPCLTSNFIPVQLIWKASLLVSVSHVVDIIHRIGGDSHWSISSVAGLWLVVGVHQTCQLCGPLPVRVDNLHRVVLSQGIAVIAILIVTPQRALAAFSEWVVNIILIVSLISPLGVDALVTTGRAHRAKVTHLPPAAPAVDAAVVIAPGTRTLSNSWPLHYGKPGRHYTGRLFMYSYNCSRILSWGKIGYMCVNKIKTCLNVNIKAQNLI